jgi:predicted RNA-binding Zn-ribbon protein involved in translation (DUF1610 family)
MGAWKECLSCSEMIIERIYATWECPKCGSVSLIINDEETDDDEETDYDADEQE